MNVFTIVLDGLFDLLFVHLTRHLAVLLSKVTREDVHDLIFGFNLMDKVTVITE